MHFSFHGNDKILPSDSRITQRMNLKTILVSGKLVNFRGFGAKNTPLTCWDNTACAHNCECLQAYCQECLAWVGKGKERWDTLFSGELADVGVATLHLWLFWDPSFCLSRAQPKTYDPLYCCFPLSIRQALKKTFQDMSWKYFLMFERKFVSKRFTVLVCFCF